VFSFRAFSAVDAGAPDGGDGRGHDQSRSYEGKDSGEWRFIREIGDSGMKCGGDREGERDLDAEDAENQVTADK
jgi:hypothetical protein